jgi:hypothetical protein
VSTEHNLHSKSNIGLRYTTQSKVELPVIIHHARLLSQSHIIMVLRRGCFVNGQHYGSRGLELRRVL